MRPGTEGGARDDGTGGTRHPGAHCLIASHVVRVSARRALARRVVRTRRPRPAPCSSSSVFSSRGVARCARRARGRGSASRTSRASSARTASPRRRATRGPGHARTRQQHERDADVEQRVAARRVRPVDHDRARSGASSRSSDAGRDARGGRRRRRSGSQSGAGSRAAGRAGRRASARSAAMRPRLPQHRVHHHRAFDAFHHDLGAARAHLVDLAAPG